MTSADAGAIRSAFLTDPGMVRRENQDACLELQGPAGEHLLLVADGMGGHLGGSTASRLLIETFREKFASDIEWNASVLEQTIRDGNATIFRTASENDNLAGMGTTAVAILLGARDGACVAHVGDSRAYRLRNGKLEQLTGDHSTVAELVRQGAISEEEAAVHPRRNEILRSVGVEADVDVEVASLEAESGDLFMLCSDGLSGVVTDETIAQTMNRLPPRDAVPSLVTEANVNGGPDNITVMICELPGDHQVQTPRWSKQTVALCAAGALVVLWMLASLLR